MKNAARIGTPTIFGPKHAHDGYAETIEALLEASRLPGEAGQEPGARRRVAATGSTAAASSSATMQVNADGTVLVATGSPDIGGSRASMAIMAAETLGVDYKRGARHRRRHRVDRLHARDRRIARDLRDRAWRW